LYPQIRELLKLTFKYLLFEQCCLFVGLLQDTLESGRKSAFPEGTFLFISYRTHRIQSSRQNLCVEMFHAIGLMKRQCAKTTIQGAKLNYCTSQSQFLNRNSKPSCHLESP